MKNKFLTLFLAFVMSAGTIEATEGALSGEFSVSSTKKVNFSQGNLQYVGTWQFATTQWNAFGEMQSDDHRDLFGWGTGDAPNKVSTNNSDYTSYTEWGNNAISNGGNTSDIWRTLSSSEWYYVLNGRPNASVLNGFAMIDDVRGFVLLPDNCQLPQEITFETSVNNWTVNHYSSDEWNVLESIGAVFFPATGVRNGQLVSHVEDGGAYWGADSICSSEWVSGGMFAENYSFAFACNEAHVGHAVRLVKDVDSPCILASGTCGAQGDNLTWELSCDSVLTIGGSGEMLSWIKYGSVKVPWNDYKSIITHVSLQDGVQSIGDNAFDGCTILRNVEIPQSVISIGDDAFCYCSALTAITVSPNNMNFTSDDGVLFDKEKTTLIRYPIKKKDSTYAIPNCVTDIKSHAFIYSSLTSIEIPEGVKNIGNEAFYDCSRLSSITIPSSVTKIGVATFAFCYALTAVNVAPNNESFTSEDGVLFNKDKTILIHCPGKKQGEYIILSSVTSILQMAFTGCNNLTSVSIPASVTSIGNNAFYNCSHLSSVINYASTPQIINSYVFQNHSSLTLYVPAKSVDVYKFADGWKQFGNILPITKPEEEIERVESEYIAHYLDNSSAELCNDTVTLRVPMAPNIEGFTFLKWQVVAGDLDDGIHLHAVYTANTPTSVSSEVINPKNSLQKLIRDGNVYILTDDKMYTITGQRTK